MSARHAFRLLRACALAGLTVRETAVVFRRVGAGNWEAKNNRELRAQGHYFRLLVRSKRP